MRTSPLSWFPNALAVLLLLPMPAGAADLGVQIPAGDAFVVRDATGAVERLRVDEATGNISRNGSLFRHTTGTANVFTGANAGSETTTRRCTPTSRACEPNVDAGSAVLVTSSGELGVAASSNRFKRDVRDMGAASDVVMRLRPVTFEYRETLSGTRAGVDGPPWR